MSQRPPEPAEPLWLAPSLPDGLYVLPPDAARPDAVGERPAEVALVAAVLVAVGILLSLIALA